MEVPPTFCTHMNVKPMMRVPSNWFQTLRFYLPPNAHCHLLIRFDSPYSSRYSSATLCRTDRCHQSVRKAFNLCCNLSQPKNLVCNIHFAHQFSSANSKRLIIILRFQIERLTPAQKLLSQDLSSVLLRSLKVKLKSLAKTHSKWISNTAKTFIFQVQVLQLYSDFAVNFLYPHSHTATFQH